MLIKPLAKLFAGSAVALVLATGGAFAVPTTMSFSVNGTGSDTVNTGNIQSNTVTKTIPAIENVGGTTGTNVPAGIFTGTTVTFSLLTLPTTTGPTNFTVSAGNLVFTFTSVSSVVIIPTGGSSNGSISEQFNGTITADTSVGQIYLGQTASISETCTQTNTGAAISCSDSVATPGLPITTPEPASLALFGAGLAGLGLIRRRRARS